MDELQTPSPSQQKSAKVRKLQVSMRTAFVIVTVLVVLLSVTSQLALIYDRKSKLLQVTTAPWPVHTAFSPKSSERVQHPSEWKCDLLSIRRIRQEL